jgi:hypothetical protein
MIAEDPDSPTILGIVVSYSRRKPEAKSFCDRPAAAHSVANLLQEA